MYINRGPHYITSFICSDKQTLSLRAFFLWKFSFELTCFLMQTHSTTYSLHSTSFGWSLVLRFCRCKMELATSPSSSPSALTPPLTPPRAVGHRRRRRQGNMCCNMQPNQMDKVIYLIFNHVVYYYAVWKTLYISYLGLILWPDFDFYHTEPCLDRAIF